MSCSEHTPTRGSVIAPKDLDALLSSPGYRQVLNIIPCGIAVFETGSEGGLHSLYCNDELCRMTGFSRDELMSDGTGGICRPIEEDREAVRQAFSSAEDGQTVSVSYRTMVQSGEVRWFQLQASMALPSDAPARSCVAFLDVTNEKVLQQQLETEMTKVNIALEQADILLWEYDVAGHCTIQQPKAMAEYLVPKVMDVPYGAIEMGLVCEESAQAYIDLHKAVDEGAPVSTADIAFRAKDGSRFYKRETYYTIFEDGKPVRAIGVAKDITQERGFQEELRYMQDVQSDSLLVKSRANVTCNVVESYEAGADVALSDQGATFLQAAGALAQHALTDEEQEGIRRLLNRDRLMVAFENGETSHSLEYRRVLNDGTVRWVSSNVKCYENPDTGDVMSFLYTYDINERMINQLMVESIVDFGFEFLGLLELSTSSLRCIRMADLERSMECAPELPYYQGYRVFVDLFIDEDMQEQALRELSPEHITEQLDANGRYSCAFPVHLDGASFRKKWEFSYLDESRQMVVFARSDITEVTRQQEQQREALRMALARAQQANVAKTAFLSRMSHEIRTPMNAIIGMSALAAQCVDKPEEVADCISKVGISARFLLSLINDILDMSRIESGKMEVKRERIPFESFVNGINAICYEQAASKGIDYECVIATFTQEAYMGDAMKLQQVLVNLLGNAIKFTDAGGKVQLIVSQERSQNGKAHMRFAVTDTGIGISEEFLPRIFEPFEQENDGVTTQYSGTGLGLAICKNLVSMMGGTINVTSILGVGSEFTVELDMDECEPEGRPSAAPLVLEHLRSLVVDDDVVICRHTKAILENMGIEADWVDSGMKAVEQVRRNWEEQRYYDIILVDWKMPDMDGIETARQIRKIVGPDVTIIIITAYDWSSIESKAKAAGVNLLITKPLFRSSLLSAFERVYSDRVQEEKPAPSFSQYDFAGFRALLVEDNALNVEVARRLLQAKGMEVDVANNGLAALEMFTTAPDYHYDMIIMDIRMPVMDGLTAARSIRHLRKEGAREVPIVAMSANAFQEDMEKSYAAGMDAHLSKPIEPGLLYETLQGFLRPL